MSRLRIAVYAIAKNEAGHVDRFMAACEAADMVLVADTGSTDGTPELLAELGARVHQIHISPWRFDDARNAALALVPRDIDVCVSLDLDELLQPGWREEIERVWVPGTTRLSYGFDWGAGIVFQYEKIHARHGYRWHHPCHEYPVPDGRISEVWAHTETLLVVHEPDQTKSRGQYLDLLQLSIEEDPHCPRNAFYYARELSFHGRWEEAIEQGERYLALPRADWPNERCYAMRVIARSWAELGRVDEARAWLARATTEAPGTREPWVELALLLYRLQDWSGCYVAATTALRITERELVYTADPAVWGARPHDLAAIAAWHLGMGEEAQRHGAAAVELDPGDERLRTNLDYYTRRPR